MKININSIDVLTRASIISKRIIMPNWCQNRLIVTGPADELERFRLKAIGPSQNYNDFRNGAWEAFDDIRVKAIISSPPELGESSDLSFHALYPVPIEIMCLPYDSVQAQKVTEKCGVEYGGVSGYTWENRNWGVKWGSTSVCTYHEDDYLEYAFDTPWAPALPFFEKVAEDFPALEFTLKYSEPGMGFEGEAIYDEGQLVSDDCWDLEETEMEE